VTGFCMYYLSSCALYVRYALTRPRPAFPVTPTLPPLQASPPWWPPPASCWCWC
jgi:hypothetical protein